MACLQMGNRISPCTSPHLRGSWQPWRLFGPWNGETNHNLLSGQASVTPPRLNDVAWKPLQSHALYVPQVKECSRLAWSLLLPAVFFVTVLACPALSRTILGDVHSVREASESRTWRFS